VSYVYKYLLQFPSEAQVRDHIIQELDGDEPDIKFVSNQKVEDAVTQSLIKNEYEPAPAERLLAAFRILDPQGTGRIHLEVMEELLLTKGIPFREIEWTQFKDYAQDKTGQYIEYEDYVAKLVEENERHKEFLLREWYIKQQKK
jgi:Ca2+-binding EF-hand superfamily protein